VRSHTTHPTCEYAPCSSSKHAHGQLRLYIALCFGFSLTVNVWIFFRVSGGLFNPAVSLGMALVGVLTPMRAALLMVVQLLGGISGAAIVDALVPGGTKAGTVLAPGVNVVQGLFMEMILTTLLMLAMFVHSFMPPRASADVHGSLFLAAEKHRATFLAPIGIGLALFVAELLGVPYTGGALNPARALGPAVVRRMFPPHHWVYWVGPALGACLAAAFYIFVKCVCVAFSMGTDADVHKVSRI
jgi:aquaporin related protein